MALTQTQLAGAFADRAEITRAEAKRVLEVRAHPRAKAKAALPSVQKARRRLAAPKA